MSLNDGFVGLGTMSGLAAGMGTSGIAGVWSDMGVNGPMDAGGNDILTWSVIDPPDDRYIAGYSSTQVDGDSKTVGPRLKDLNIPFSLYGLPIPITFGVRKLYSNIIWAIPLRENIKKNSDTGKGSGTIGTTAQSTEYEYYATYAVAFGYAGLPDVGNRNIIRVWADGTLIYNRRGTGQQKIAGFKFKFYDGSETQEADPLIEAKEGVGNVPGFRGLMYMVIDDLPVKGWGDRPPAISVEIGDATEGTFSITNISSDVFLGSDDIDWVLVDDATNQAIAVPSTSSNGWPIRVYDFNSNTRLSTSLSNPYPGAGWAGLVQNLNTANLSHWTGLEVTTGQYWTYIPWLGLVAGQAAWQNAGSSPVILVDPFTGLTRYWIGSSDEGPGVGFPLMDELMLMGYEPEKRHYPASTPHMDKLCAQLGYTLLGANTYIMGNTIYSDTVIYKLDGVTGILDMLYYDGFNPDIVAPGGVYPVSSEFFTVEGNIIYKYIVTSGARRIFVNPGSYTEGVTREVYKNMGAGINNIYYYRSEDALIVMMDSGTVKKLDARDSSVEIWSIDSVPLPTGHQRNFHLNNSDGGYLSWGSGTVTELDLTFGAWEQFPIGSIDWFVELRPYVNSLNKSITGVGTGGSGGEGPDQTSTKNNAVCRYFYDRITDIRIPLADFIMGMAILAGYEEADIIIDASIDDMIDGAIIASGTTFRRVMDPVMVLYRIDMIETEGKIKFTRKAIGYTGSDFDIPQGETLLNNPTSPQDSTFQFSRGDEVTTPRRINVRYIDKGLDYQWSMMFATRAFETNNSTNEITFEVPIVMTASEAKTLANGVMYYAWNSRMSFSFRLSPKHFKMEPGDVGSLTDMGLGFRIKAVEVTYNNDFSIGVRGTSFLADTATVIEGYAGVGYPQVISPTTGAQVFLIDVPILRADDDLNYAGAFPLYVSVNPQVLTNAWGGGTAIYSPGGIDYSTLATSIEEGTVMTVTSAPAVPDSVLQMDFVNDMTVVPRAGNALHLASATLDELNDGANTAAYGVDGRWEIIQFMDVTDNGNGTYTLHGIRRARRGTDYAVDSHLLGDYLILLNTSWTQVASFTHDQTELSLSYKGVGFGQNPALIIPKRTTLHGYAALPWVPTVPELRRTIAAGTGDLLLRWKRRDRVTGVIVDNNEYVHNGSTETLQYKITIKRLPRFAFYWDSGVPAWQTILEGVTVEYPKTQVEIITDVYPENYTPHGQLINDGWYEYDLTAAIIREHMLYEFLEPDNVIDEFTTFSAVSGQTLSTNEEEHEVAEALGYNEWTAFTYLDIMIQEKTKIPNSTGWGPGRFVRVQIKDL